MKTAELAEGPQETTPGWSRSFSLRSGVRSAPTPTANSFSPYQPPPQTESLPRRTPTAPDQRRPQLHQPRGKGRIQPRTHNFQGSQLRGKWGEAKVTKGGEAARG